MRKFILVISLNILLFNTLYSQGSWTLQNPRPVSEDLLDIYNLPGTSTSWVCGTYGTILKTLDNGNKWTKLNSGTTLSLNAVQFTDGNNGYSVGASGIILKTTNGGVNWQNQVCPVTSPLNNLQFISSNVGWIVGNSGTILKTTNAGTNWAVQASGTTIPLYSLSFVTSSTGWVAGGAGIILKTTDGGASWISLNSGTTDYLKSIFFADINTGWVASSNGKILKTTNGGTTWTQQNSGHANGITSIFFRDLNHGWAVDVQGYYYKTTDGGANWASATIGTTNLLTSICMSNNLTGWFVGNKGVIYRTNDDGTTWNSLTSGTTIDLSDVFFINENVGWAVGYSGTILKTINGGETWTAQTSGTTYILENVYFTDINTGWIAGSGGTILKTTDGGNSWVKQTSNTSAYLYGMYFSNSQNGWIVCFTGDDLILRTTDGGTTWTKHTKGTNYWQKGIHFVSNTGWTVGYGGAIYKSSNGGITWISQNSGTTNSLNDVYFLNSDLGWAVGGAGTILKTTSGGSAWTTLTPGINDNLVNVKFTNTNDGWIFASSGNIYKTLDGGISWSLIANGFCSDQMKNSSFIDINNGWAAGPGGIIAKYINNSPSSQSNSIIVSGITFQNANVSWARGGGNQCAVFIKQGSAGSCIPDVNVTYLPNSAFGAGDQIGNTGWYCIYNGTGTSVNVTGLQPNTSYRIQVCEYNFTSDFIYYNASTAVNNPISFTTAVAPPQITSNPVNRTICETMSATFSSSASGTGLSYKWQVDQGSGFINLADGNEYSGSTTTSLTVISAPAAFSGYKYQCVVSNVSGNATSNAALLTINPLPLNPTGINGDTIVCVNSSYVYSISPVTNANSYNWTFPAGFTGTASDNTVTLQIGSSAISGLISVNGNNSCGSGPVRNLRIRVKQVPDNASGITGLSTVCTGAVNTGYYTDPINGADSYVWTYPFGASGNSSINSIMITFGNDPQSGLITVRGHNMCGDGLQSSFPVTLTTVPPAIGSISGENYACRNQKDIPYKVTSIPNATSYSWSLPAGVTGSNSTKDVLLNFGPDATSGDLKVAGVNSCGTGAEITFPVIVNDVPQQAGAISGRNIVCSGDVNVVYTVPVSERATSYKWELPDGSTENTLVNRIVLNFNNVSSSGNLNVTPYNACGAGGSSNLFIDVSVLPSPTIMSGDKTELCFGDSARLVVSQIENITYRWYKDGITVGKNSSHYTAREPGLYKMTIEDVNGCISESGNTFNIKNKAGALEKPVLYVQGPVVWYMAASNDKAAKYKWYRNDQPIQGADKFIYLANKTLGTYKVAVGNSEGCFTISDPVTIPVNKGEMTSFKIPAELKTVENIDPFENIKIYPNPTPGLFTIEMDNSLIGELNIDILSQEGRKILNIKFEKTTDHFKSEVDLSGQAKGMYIINLLLNNFAATRKVMVR